MAMSKTLTELLATAIQLSLDLTEDNPELSAAIEAVEALGDEGTMGDESSKALKVLVKDLTAKDKNKKGGDDKSINKPTSKKEKVDYAGIKQIGSLWYCKEDGYKKSFATADECAKNFNG